MTNLQKTKKTGFMKLFTFVDYATRYVYAFPTRNEKAITLLPYIKHLMSHYGKGLVFHADQGRNFVSQEFVDFVEKAGCFMDYKAPYNPQASPIERYITPCHRHGSDKFLCNPVNCTFSEASCYVDSKTLFKKILTCYSYLVILKIYFFKSNW